jgi:hypothetical protein
LNAEKVDKYLPPCMDEKRVTEYPWCRPGAGRNNENQCSIFIAIGCHGFYLSSDEAVKDRCEFYPTDKELNKYGPFCGCNSDISGGVCTIIDSKKCRWAIERREDGSIY